MNTASKFQRHINQQRKFVGGRWDTLEDVKEWAGEYFTEKRPDGTGWDSGYKNSDAYDELSDPTHRFVWAQYETGNYEGCAAAYWVDWEGNCWLADCSHCSCNGLDTWIPVESNENYIRSRIGKDLGMGRYNHGPADKNVADVFEQVMEEIKHEKDILHSST